MHELSLCEGILQVIEEQHRNGAFTRVRTLWLEIGALAGVEPDALRFGFDVVTRGSVAEGARLEIIEQPGQAWCLPCGAQVVVAARHSACPRCHSHQLQVTGGEELRIHSMEVE
ncbi:hydrogenase maturation nickel metallochaperone HypA [Thioalbus denitrificans]|uniref:Hydrogenase maturation factor HypA n=1 Tax=Thioalbus denitrificans TaxID=547122 RepID=A0A369CLV3_9GAMM|nr:hydrogenase maturation nickel metallochaperone HypA [Thioalbus denitrificans]RCX32844.1 hydrogenase-3 nickel incorporation protein HypA [Thioalbus denitrificans]